MNWKKITLHDYVLVAEDGEFLERIYHNYYENSARVDSTGKVYISIDAAKKAVQAAIDEKNVEPLPVVDKGPWEAKDEGNGRIAIYSDDFTHDVGLVVHGDFGKPEEKFYYASRLAEQLNSSIPKI